jgi:hypothetical protein
VPCVPTKLTNQPSQFLVCGDGDVATIIKIWIDLEGSMDGMHGSPFACLDGFDEEGSGWCVQGPVVALCCGDCARV